MTNSDGTYIDSEGAICCVLCQDPIENCVCQCEACGKTYNDCACGEG